jgi:HSP20 family protein
MLNYPVFRSESSWAPLAELRREMDRLFDDWTPSASATRALNAEWQPACEVDEGDDHYLISLEMAGISKDQIKLETVDHQLVISGERNRQSKRKQEGQSYTERRYGRFQRSFTLPSGVDSSRIEANYQDGILRVYVPKAESSKPRQIKITNGSHAGFFGKLLGQTPNSSHPSSEAKTEKVA